MSINENVPMVPHSESLWGGWVVGWVGGGVYVTWGSDQNMDFFNEPSIT